MEGSVCIEQKGTVEQIAGHNIKVRVHRMASCGDCRAGTICFMGESTEREIEISNFTPGLKIGDQVEVILSRSMGNKAVVLGYLMPFIILILSLIIMKLLGAGDLLSGLISLGSLAPYFIILYLLRNRLRKVFTLSARKT